MNRSDLDQAAEIFLEKLKFQADLHGLLFEDRWDIDHLCFRVATSEAYQRMRRSFCAMSTLLAESFVNGREIATFKFERGIVFGKRRIDLIELPAPKLGKTTPEGFEHVEVVSDLAFAELEQLFSPALRTRLQRKGLAKLFNPELEVELEGVNVKFHHQSLENVIRCETNEKQSLVLTSLGRWPGLSGSEILFLDEAEMMIFDPSSRRTSDDVEALKNDLLQYEIKLRFETDPQKLSAALRVLHDQERHRKYGVA